MTEFFSFQNNPKTLDQSNKTDLDPWDCLERVKLILKQNVVILEGEKNPPIAK